MILPEFPIFDDRVAPERSAFRTKVYTSIVASIFAHLSAWGACYGVAFLLAWLGFERPEISLRSQRASIELQASIEAAPESAREEFARPRKMVPPRKPESPPPELAPPIAEVVARKLPVTEAGMLPIPVEAAFVAVRQDPPPLERMETTPADAPSPRETMAPPKRKVAAAVAPVETVASSASVAVEGSEFDEPPEPHANNEKPPYPADALSRGLQGVVTIRLRINSTGEVESAVVVESSGTTSLDESARRTALQWRFEPARLRGSSVVATIDKPIRFTLRNSG